MPKTYDPAPPETHERVTALIHRYHPDLEKVGLRVDLLMASTDSEDAHAVTHGGYPALAVVKILGPKERAMGRGDAEIVIDRDEYEAMPDEERDALIDHELYHINLKLDKHGSPKRDDHQRPLLVMRKHDRQFGFFDEIARRHGAHSVEVQQATAWRDETGQLYFGFTSLVDSLKRMAPEDGASVTIHAPGSAVGVKIDKTRVHAIADPAAA